MKNIKDSIDGIKKLFMLREKMKNNAISYYIVTGTSPVIQCAEALIKNGVGNSTV
jgi:hypothetical protein